MKYLVAGWPGGYLHTAVERLNSGTVLIWEQYDCSQLVRWGIFPGTFRFQIQRLKPLGYAATTRTFFCILSMYRLSQHRRNFQSKCICKRSTIAINNDYDPHRFQLCPHLVCAIVVLSIFLQLLLKNVKVSRLLQRSIFPWLLLRIIINPKR